MLHVLRNTAISKLFVLFDFKVRVSLSYKPAWQLEPEFHFNGHCFHGIDGYTAIKHPVPLPDRVKPSFVIFDKGLNGYKIKRRAHP